MLDGRIKNKPGINKLPILGKIRVGEKKTSGSGKEYPVSLDYFKADGNYADKFTKIYGQKPNQLEILFLSDNIEDCCFQRYELWKGKKLFGFGDGEEFLLWNKEKEEYQRFLVSQVPDIQERAAKKAEAEWSEVLTLRFFLTQFREVLGVWQLDTRAAKSSIQQIVSTFDFVLEKRGSVVGVAFDLKVEKVTSTKPDSKSVFPVISLIPKGGAATDAAVKLIEQSS